MEEHKFIFLCVYLGVMFVFIFCYFLGAWILSLKSDVASLKSQLEMERRCHKDEKRFLERDRDRLQARLWQRR